MERMQKEKEQEEATGSERWQKRREIEEAKERERVKATPISREWPGGGACMWSEGLLKGDVEGDGLVQEHVSRERHQDRPWVMVQEMLCMDLGGSGVWVQKCGIRSERNVLAETDKRLGFRHYTFGFRLRVGWLGLGHDANNTPLMVVIRIDPGLRFMVYGVWCRLHGVRGSGFRVQGVGVGNRMRSLRTFIKAFLRMLRHKGEVTSYLNIFKTSRTQKGTSLPWNPTAGPSLGPYGGPRGGGCFLRVK
jgi:hypothetical protein